MNIKIEAVYWLVRDSIISELIDKLIVNDDYHNSIYFYLDDLEMQIGLDSDRDYYLYIGEAYIDAYARPADLFEYMVGYMFNNGYLKDELDLVLNRLKALDLSARLLE